MERLARMPVPILPTFVGALTLSNVYSGMGYLWIRHLTMWAGTLVFLLYCLKIVKFPQVVRQEYETPVPASLYAAFTMILMILGSYYADYLPILGKGMWMVGLGLHMLHILLFTYQNVIRKRDVHTFLPSWFVTYNGILVSSVVGTRMHEEEILTCVVYYGIGIYAILIPMMIWRLIRVEIKTAVYHTMAVVLAPCSLCVVGYLNVIEQPCHLLICVLYVCVVASLLFVILKLPWFFSFAFSPGFAGMTFPMAIGIVASTKMAGYLERIGAMTWSRIITQLSGIQFYLTTMIIGYVILQFLIIVLGIERK